MFKQGDQFYLQIQITDKNDNVLDINGVIYRPKVYL